MPTPTAVIDDLGAGRPLRRERPQAPAMPVHVMPDVALGDSVLWCTDESGTPDKLAIVTRVYNESVDLWVLETGCHNGLPVDGVRHITHPDRTLIKNTGSGVWEHRPRHLDLLAMEQRLLALEGLAAVTAVTLKDPRETPRT